MSMYGTKIMLKFGAKMTSKYGANVKSLELK